MGQAPNWIWKIWKSFAIPEWQKRNVATLEVTDLKLRASDRLTDIGLTKQVTNNKIVIFYLNDES